MKKYIRSFFKHKQIDWKKRQELEFISAINRLKNFSVTGSRCSIDPEDIRDYVIARRQELSHLVDPKHRQEPPQDASDLVPEACVEVISWRRLNDQAAIRYVCLQALDGRGFCVASAGYFSAEVSAAPQHDEERRIAQRLIGVGSELPLEWHPTLAAALEAHESAI